MTVGIAGALYFALLVFLGRSPSPSSKPLFWTLHNTMLRVRQVIVSHHDMACLEAAHACPQPQRFDSKDLENFTQWNLQLFLKADVHVYIHWYPCYVHSYPCYIHSYPLFIHLKSNIYFYLIYPYPISKSSCLFFFGCPKRAGAKNTTQVSTLFRTHGLRCPRMSLH